MTDVPILGSSKQVPNETVELVWTALMLGHMHLSAVDASNAAANATQEVRPRPLTQMLHDALKALNEAVR